MGIPGSLASPPSSSDQGFVAHAVDELLDAQADLIARIKLCYGVDRESFEREIMALIRRYAAYVHLLPATADNYFSSPGGLLRLGLETGFYSLQATDAHIFSGRMTISARRALEPRWRHATFIAGLCCELHRVFTQVIVTESRGHGWSAYVEPLAGWCERHRAQRYFVRWERLVAEVRGLGVFALPHVVPTETMAHLSLGNSPVVPHMMASISGMPSLREHNVLDSLVRRSLALVIDRDLLSRADRQGAAQVGSHLARYLVDAMRSLLVSHAGWLPNGDKTRVWFGTDGLFLLWPNAADDVLKLLEADQLAGMPKSPQAILDVLHAAQLIEGREEHDLLWTILPPGAKTALEAVKLKSDLILFAGICAPDPVNRKLARDPSEAEPATAAPQHPAQVQAGAQMSLIPAVNRPAEAAVPRSGVQEMPATDATAETIVAVVYSLDAPMRLQPAVRDALAAIIQTLNDPSRPPQCCAVAHGVFVPLGEFERRGIQPSLAVRALDDVRMLVPQRLHGPPTLTWDFGGVDVLGVVLNPRFVTGFDLDGFTPHSSRSQ
jgi:conjugal transfer pilus assembly protein TraI